MKNHFITLCIVLIALTGFFFITQTSKKIGKAPTIEEQILSSDKILTPKDLGITKHVMNAQHGDDEVVVLRCKWEFDGDLVREIIEYHRASDNKIISIPYVEINKSRLALMSLNKPKGQPDFCDNIEIWCGGFGIEFDHLYFERSDASHSEISLKAGKRIASRNKNEIVVKFNEQWEGKGRELKLTFSLEPILYTDALKEYPKLSPIEANQGWTARNLKHGNDTGRRKWSDSVKRGNDGSLYKTEEPE